MEQMKEIQIIPHFDKEPLLVNQYTINHGPDKFILDFSNLGPQFNPNGEAILIMNHKVVMFDPYFMKAFASLLVDNIKKYENLFGPIKKPEAVLKAEKEAKKNQLKSGATTSDKVSYVG